jgi:hypothetical protein
MRSFLYPFYDSGVIPSKISLVCTLNSEGSRLFIGVSWPQSNCSSVHFSLRRLCNRIMHITIWRLRFWLVCCQLPNMHWWSAWFTEFLLCIKIFCCLNASIFFVQYMVVLVAFLLNITSVVLFIAYYGRCRVIFLWNQDCLMLRCSYTPTGTSSVGNL